MLNSGQYFVFYYDFPSLTCANFVLKVSVLNFFLFAGWFYRLYCTSVMGNLGWPCSSLLLRTTWCSRREPRLVPKTHFNKSIFGFLRVKVKVCKFLKHCDGLDPVSVGISQTDVVAIQADAVQHHTDLTHRSLPSVTPRNTIHGELAADSCAVNDDVITHCDSQTSSSDVRWSVSASQ